ncbi:hypothetical protein SARC_11680 [Sphaeroforma arctica JP610]|uniref:Prolyl 4-hydroxylase alpha subunit Fe(2+) 2OG dioxygenase domain-containing protein n=1 Tax=Sphaeroforma arctica JP610 TaxID=667725 RepID=A0A0L0FGA8_9EUKA|nr:hypothetical protein SARC_11680 [Sphaeroforma arctica JP610]KNC75800.1 hypothetical protein SARC_11680 [Sphaeroforma arctica JP610]|eukprot:XP_014149702.1 hypothetical protein SARC_11680 [Sphaeroforma arctica JP610]
MTGRPEGTNVACPWGYGDDFDTFKVPTPLRTIQDRIMKSEHFHVGAPRDITVNYRQHSLFKLDPHYDPRTDGGNIFIINFLSYVVLTLTPEHPVNHGLQTDDGSIVDWFGDQKTLLKRDSERFSVVMAFE